MSFPPTIVKPPLDIFPDPKLVPRLTVQNIFEGVSFVCVPLPFFVKSFPLPELSAPKSPPLENFK